MKDPNYIIILENPTYGTKDGVFHGTYREALIHQAGIIAGEVARELLEGFPVPDGLLAAVSVRLKAMASTDRNAAACGLASLMRIGGQVSAYPAAEAPNDTAA